MRKFFATVFAVTLLQVSGCATIVSGTDQEVTFNSEPEGATVSVTGKVLGKTPVTIRLDKEKNQILTFEKEGYKTYTTQMSTTMDGWFWGNIVIGGFFGSTTDGASGAINEYSPDQYFVTLTPNVPFGVSQQNKAGMIKELMVAFGDSIREEIITGNGDNLSQLITVIGSSSGKEVTLEVLRKLNTDANNNLELAEKINAFYSFN